jgi:hypothetical protein
MAATQCGRLLPRCFDQEQHRADGKDDTGEQAGAVLRSEGDAMLHMANLVSASGERRREQKNRASS